jgi:hypothetical protein
MQILINCYLFFYFAILDTFLKIVYTHLRSLTVQGQLVVAIELENTTQNLPPVHSFQIIFQELFAFHILLELFN